MATAGGSHIIRDGLVFGYDTGYPVFSKDQSTVNYKGRPTANIITDEGSMSGWSSYSAGNDGTFTTEFGTTGYRMNNRLSWNGCYKDFTLPSTGTYTFSAYIRYWGGDSANNGATVYVNGYGGGDTATGINKGIKGQWQRIERTVNVTDVTVRFYLISYGGNSSVDRSSWDVTMPQIEKQSTRTPFVNGTRSSTESLYDLARSATIDVSNVSFNSTTGLPTFDGSNDTIEISDHGITSVSNLTVSYWFKMNWVSSWSPFITLMDSNGTQKFHTWFGSDRGIDFQTSINSVKPMFVATAGAYPNNDYINIVMTINGTGSNNIKCYVNGEYKAQGSVTFNTHNIANLRIGRDPGSAYGGGDLSNLKIYNRVLSDQEIQQNFNAYKPRFNL